MAKLNVPNKNYETTFNGAPVKVLNDKQRLLRSVMACMLWEDTFYEDGVDIAKRIEEYVSKLDGLFVSSVALQARQNMKLRHMPLLLARLLAKGTPTQRQYVADLLDLIVQRPDELTEFLAIYWKDGRQPLSAQVKKGLARAFTKFNPYQLAKYNRDGAVKLRDVLFLTHPKTPFYEQQQAWDKLVNGTLESPDTWEVALSAGADKKETFTRLIQEGKLGALALLRNLRNMEEVGVDSDLIKSAILNMNTERVLPFRFIAAAKHAPKYEAYLEQAMFKCLEGMDKIQGKTVLLVDNSGSMYGPTISAKSDLQRVDAAGALAILLREICPDIEIIAFAGKPTVVPARRGFALAEAIKNTERGGTYTGKAVTFAAKEGYDRIIILTDEQSNDTIPNPLPGTRGYTLNVAAYKNGVGYGAWMNIDGWSEATVDFIRTLEKEF